MGSSGWSLHNDVEEVIAICGNVTLAEGCDEFHGLQGVIDLLAGCIGAPDRINELCIDLDDLVVAFATITGRISSIPEEIRGLISSLERLSLQKFNPFAKLFSERGRSGLVIQYSFVGGEWSGCRSVGDQVGWSQDEKVRPRTADRHHGQNRESDFVRLRLNSASIGPPTSLYVLRVL